MKPFFDDSAISYFLLLVLSFYIAPPLKLVDLPGVDKGNLGESLVSCLST